MRRKATRKKNLQATRIKALEAQVRQLESKQLENIWGTELLGMLQKLIDERATDIVEQAIDNLSVNVDRY